MERELESHQRRMFQRVLARLHNLRLWTAFDTLQDNVRKHGILLDKRGTALGGMDRMIRRWKRATLLRAFNAIKSVVAWEALSNQQRAELEQIQGKQGDLEAEIKARKNATFRRILSRLHNARLWAGFNKLQEQVSRRKILMTQRGSSLRSIDRMVLGWRRIRVPPFHTMLLLMMRYICTSFYARASKQAASAPN